MAAGDSGVPSLTNSPYSALKASSCFCRSGWPWNSSASLWKMAAGEAFSIQISLAGTPQLGSSSVPTVSVTSGKDKGSCHSRVPQVAQRTTSLWRPESAVRR